MPTGFTGRQKGKEFFAAGSLTQAGKGLGATFGSGGQLQANTVSVASTGTNTLQALMPAYSLPPNALDMPGRTLYLQAWGTFAGNAASKSLTVTVGTATYNTGTTTQSGGGWEIFANMTKNAAANSQEIMFDSTLGTTKGGVTRASGTNTEASAISVSVQCTDASAAQTNVVQYGQIISWNN